MRRVIAKFLLVGRTNHVVKLRLKLYGLNMTNSNFSVLKRPLTRWDDIFFSTAVIWSRMSHDSETQCGCVLVKDSTIISTGYNGFIRGIDDSVLPRTRPDKYPFMIHSEQNAIYNCSRLGKSTLGSTAYITGPPCINCLQALYQAGIAVIYFSDISNPKVTFANPEYMKIIDMIKEKIEISFVPKSSILKDFLIESANQMR